ncbi:hypothetical protein M3J09_005140 [Ascochyta lentis]
MEEVVAGRAGKICRPPPLLTLYTDFNLQLLLAQIQSWLLGRRIQFTSP